jgi:hypothetical protein
MNKLYTNSRDECHKDINELCYNGHIKERYIQTQEEMKSKWNSQLATCHGNYTPLSHSCVH